MKNKGRSLKIAFGILAVMLLTGCSFGIGKSDNLDPQVKKIINNWKAVTNLTYDVNIVKQKDQTDNSITGTFKVYTKDRVKTRVEILSEGKQAVFVNDSAKNLSFIYFPETKVYYQTNAFADGAASSNLSVSQRLDDVYTQLGTTFKVVGKEDIHGVTALVLENKQTSGALEKIWISEAQSVPLKFQNYNEKGELIYDIEFTNISTAVLSDDLFTMPADAKSSSLDDLLKDYKKK